MAARSFRAGEPVLPPEPPLLCAPNPVVEDPEGAPAHPACFACNFPLDSARVRCAGGANGAGGCAMPLCERACGESEAHQRDCRMLRDMLREDFKVWVPRIYSILFSKFNSQLV